MRADDRAGQDVEATIFNIQRYSIHDGPGIRTTIFFKGCNMNCAWCENPESIASEPQVGFHAARCIACGECARAGHEGRAEVSGFFPVRSASGAGRCPTGALEVIGRRTRVGEILAEALRDRDFFTESGGGVTISGGEASLQFEALRSLLALLRDKGVHSVLQTNGLMAWERMEALASYVGLFHFDLKGIDPLRHRENTGVDNATILANAARISRAGYPVVFRIPIIPTHNDSPEDLRGMAEFLDGIHAARVDVIPYHDLGEAKLETLGIEGGRLGIPSMETDAAFAAALALRGRYREVRVSGEIVAE